MNQTGTIGDIKKDVIDALQQRSDIPDSDVAYYAAKAIGELTESYPFPELQTTGPTVSLTVDQSVYPITTFLNVGDDYSMPESFTIYVDFPTNSVSSQVKYKTMAAIEALTAPAVQGIPAWYTRFGANFHFGPVPQQPYAMLFRYQTKHPFSPTPTLNDPLYLTRSWYDIAAYATAMRIAVIKRWTDQRKELHDMLFGDPEFINSEGKRGRPGLIAARVFQQERDEAINSRNISIVVGRYSAR